MPKDLPLAALLLLACCMTVVAATPQSELAQLERIEIETGTGALSGRGLTSLRITRTHTGFVMNGECHPVLPFRISRNLGDLAARDEEAKKNICPMQDAPVNAKHLAALFDAITAPVEPQPTLSAYGLSPQKLRELASRACQLSGGRSACKDGSAAQQQLFIRDFANERYIRGIVANLHKRAWLDDFASISVVIIMRDGRRITANSETPVVYMSPWLINGKSSYNGAFSSALFAILPENAADRKRLSLDYLLKTIGDDVMASINSRWEMTNAEEHIAPALALLRQNFTIDSSSINSYRSLSYNNGENMQAILRRNHPRSAWRIDLTLTMRDDKVANLDGFLSLAPDYERQLAARAWLRAYLSSHATLEPYLEYVFDASLSESAAANFALDMRAIHHCDLADEVIEQRRKIAFLYVFNDHTISHWLLMPDGRLILWRYYGARKLLHWRVSEVESHDCKTLAQYGEHCSGSVITPDGRLLPTH